MHWSLITNGVIIQWGLVETTEPFTGKYVTLPISFSTTNLATLITDHQVTGMPGLVHSSAGLYSISQIYICHSTNYMCWTNFNVIGY